MCANWKLRIHPNLRQPNFRFTSFFLSCFFAEKPKIKRKNTQNNGLPDIYLIWTYNLGQRVRDKLRKLIKIDFSMEWLTADLLLFFTEKRQNLAFGCTVGYSPSNPSISRIFLNLPNFRTSYLKSFVNLWDNSYIHFLAIII